MRAFLLMASVVWLASFAVAMVTIIPLGVMGLIGIFDRSFSATERLQGLGFFALALLAIAALLATLTLISRSFTKVARAQNR